MPTDEQDSWLSHPILGVDVGSLIDNTVQAGSNIVQQVETTGAAVAQQVEDIVSPVIQNVAATGASVIQQVESTGAAIVQDAAAAVAGAVQSIVDDGGASVADSAADLWQKAKNIAGAVGQEITDPYQYSGVQAPIVRRLQDITADGHPVEARPLTPDELADAQDIFGDSLDYSKVRVDGGNVASLGASRTIGNTVHLQMDYFAPGSSETTTEGKRILVHELTHVWQYQHKGWTYAPKALWAQAKAAIKGDRNGAYDWQSVIHQPWDEWNPEAQAEAVEDYNRALHKVHDHTATREDYATLSQLAPVMSNLTAGPST